MKSYVHLLFFWSFSVFSSLPLVANEEFETIESELVDRAVVMQLPEGVRRIRVQIRNTKGIWETCTIAHLKGTEGFLKLRLPDGATEEDIEVAASWTDPFPYEFYSGSSKFDPTQTDSNTYRAAPGGPETVDAGEAGETTVEESDIWKWRDGILYFFNQYRGLQVIDATDPAAPKRLASMRIPSSGEQLYIHPSEAVAILLTYDGSTGNGLVLLVEHTVSNELKQTAAIPIPGYIIESRLVGSILYVVSRQWWQESIVDPDTGVEHINWQSGLAVSKLDLTDPANPVTSDPLELRSGKYDYWGAQVQATPEALLVSTNAYDSSRRQSISTVHVVDISNPSVDPVVSHQVPVKGHVLDKFNLRLKENILTVVSQVWRGINDRRRFASVETFDLSESSGSSEAPIEPLAELEFANNESITATRFAGDLLYVVTVLRIDPLFVVSLADPANPQLLGELEVPGFSTHLEVLGEDALISVGVEGSQVAVSWFDVSNPAAPELASRVFVGAEDGWSWTEANWDEKAFGFFPNDGLILLPYQGSVPDVGWTAGVKIIEIGDGELIKRGSFEHEFQARRARVFGDAVVSISGRSLKSLDITDPDNPVLLAKLTLAWPADYVHRVGDYLIQLERGPGYWYYGSNDTQARLNVSPVADTDELLTSLELSSGRIVGSLLLDDCLIVAQSSFESSLDENEIAQSSESFTATIIDMGDPENPKVLGSATDTSYKEGYFYGFGADYRGELLPDGSLVWFPAEQNFYYLLEPGIGGIDARAGDFLYPYYPASGRVYTVAIANKEHPQILSSFGLLTEGEQNTETTDYWPEADVRFLESVLYYGLQTSEYVEKKEAPSQWMARHWLGQVDLEDPANPQKRDLVEIPGTFENVISNQNGGLFLFSSTFQSFYTNEFWQTEFRIQALAFDGLEAFLVDELEDEFQGYGPKVFSDQFIVLGNTDYTTEQPVTALTTYEWLASGSFLKHQTLEHPGAIHRLDVVDDLLVAPGSGELSFIDFADPIDPARTTISFPNINFWQRLDLIDVYDREVAYLPQGWYGVDSLDFDGAFLSEDPIELPRLQAGPATEWTSIGLDLFTLTSAGSDFLLGELAEDELWVYAESVEQFSYDAWMRRALDLGAEDPVPLSSADSDGDRLNNGWEYFSGTHPGDPFDAVPLESLVSREMDGTRYLNLRMAVNLHASDTTNLIPQYSDNLNDWNVLPELFEVNEEAFNPAKVIRYLEPIGSENNVFIRLLLSTSN